MVLCKTNCILKYFNNVSKNHRIALYATASTTSAAYIIGGATRRKEDITNDSLTRSTSRIMEYRNAEWHKIGTLNSFRRGISSINYGDDTMIIGGITDDER